MAEIINLRQARKRKARADAEKKATENRARHGIDKTSRKRKELDRRKLDETLDGAKVEAEAEAEAEAGAGAGAGAEAEAKTESGAPDMPDPA